MSANLMTRFREEVYNAKWYRTLVQRAAQGPTEEVAKPDRNAAKAGRTAYFEAKGRQETRPPAWRRLDGF